MEDGEEGGGEVCGAGGHGGYKGYTELEQLDFHIYIIAQVTKAENIEFLVHIQRKQEHMQ